MEIVVAHRIDILPRDSSLLKIGLQELFNLYLYNTVVVDDV